MLFPVRLRLTKNVSISCILSLLIMSAPQPEAVAIRHEPVRATQMRMGMPVGIQPPSQQQMINVAVWRTDHGFVSTMHIKNSLTTGPITAIPVLYSEGGEEYDLPSVTIPGAGITSVVVNQALDSLPAQQRIRFGNIGSAAIKYMVKGAGGLNASMQLLDKSASLSYSFPFFSYMPMADSMSMPNSAPMPGPMQQVSEAVWWKHDPGVEGHVALANSAASPLTATVQLTGAKGSKTHLKSVTLQPYASSVLDLAELESDLPGSERNRGGLTVTYMANSSQIAMAGWLENAAEGYSAKIPFVEKMSEGITPTSTAPTSHTLAGVGIMYGQQMATMGFPRGTKFEPYAVVRNTTSKQIQVSMTVLPANGGVGTEKPLGDMVLDAFETKQLDAGLIRRALPDASGNINLTFSYTGMSGDLLFATGAVDQTGNYIFEVPIGGVSSSRGREVNYWSVKDGDDTMISLWNPTAAAETLNLTLYFAGSNGKISQYVLGVPLAPRAAANISLMDLIMSGHPDAKGNLIPRGITEGSLVISAASGRHDAATYVAAVAIFNAASATCWPNCTQCIGVCDIEASPGAYSIYVGQGVPTSSVYAYWYDGSVDDITGDVNWFGPTTSGVLDSNWNGIGAGETSVYATYEAPYTSCLECEESHGCLSQYYYAYVYVTVSDPTPNIIGISSLQAGTPNILTITGSGFGTNQPGINITDPSGAIYQNYYVTSYGDTQIQVHVDVAGTAPVENASVTVTSAGYANQPAGFGFQSSQGNSSHSATSTSVNPAGVSITAPLGVVNGNSAGFAISDPNNLTVALFINSSGNGRATFSGGATSTQITQGSTVTVSGTAISSTANDLTIKATDPYGNQYLSKNFTVIWVTISNMKTTGALSGDDDAAHQFSISEGNTLDGLSVAYNGSEIQGNVSPSNFTDNIKFVQTLISTACYLDAVDGHTPTDCGKGFGNSYNCGSTDYTTCRVDDSGGGTNQDITPAPNGNIYTWDTPGTGPPPSAGISRFRSNFAVYAFYPSSGSTGVRASNIFTWSSASSALLRSDGSSARETTYNSYGDNQASTANIKTSWNLK